MASTKLNRTFGSGGNRLKWTWSGWIKRSNLGSNQCIFSAYENATNFTICSFESDDQLRFGDESSGNTNGRIISNMTFRDTSAWYHLVFVFDKNNATSGDKIKMYVNGERITSFSDTGNVPSDTGQMNNSSLGRPHEIGCVNNSDFFDGSMSHIHFCDGYAYLPSDFGETDSTTGEWKIKTSPNVQYGSTGYWILKDGNTVTDSSPNSNAWTVAGGTLTKTEDNPSNNFATLNVLFKCQNQASSFSNGATTGQSPNSQGCGGISTLAASSGKFYAEFKQSAESTTNEGAIGVCDTYYMNNNDNLGGSSNPGYIEYSVACFGLRDGSGGNFYSSNGSKVNNSSGQHGNWVNGDIIMVAMDLDNNRVYFGKNGQWQNTTSWNSATPNTYITLDSTGFEDSYHFIFGDSSSGNNVTWQANFGNGYFGTTQITSAGTNASNNGLFEYDVPTGYTALSTKGLNL